MSNSKSRSVRGRLFTTTLLAGAAALGAPAAVGLLTALAPASALAQDYTSGTFVGHVTDASGAPVAGARASVRSQGTGQVQTSTTDATGTFRAPLVPGGAYSVTITKDGFATINQSDLAVRVGGESNYGFTLTNPNDVSEVVVVAKKPQPQLDFSQTTQGVSIDVEQLQKQVPIARNVAAVALLAPGVTTSVRGFTTTNGEPVPSIGGGSAGENAYFINGLNITNFDTYIGGATIPFDFYKTIEVKTGGYPAEFGRATGGVLNATTKSGTNDFYFAVHGDFQPDFARSNAPNTYATDNARTKSDSAQTSFEVGGPIIRDHLFFYGLYQLNHTINEGASISGGTFTKSRDNSPFYGYKIDGYLTSRQHFEFTDFNTSDKSFQNSFGFTYPQSGKNYISPVTGVAYANGNDVPGSLGPFLGATAFKSGGNSYVGKYTGTFTDWFTISAAYGQSKDESYTLPGTGTLPYIYDSRATGVAVKFPTSPVPSSNASTSIDNTERQFYRVDGDIYVNFLGRHHFRAGYDHEGTRETKSTFLSGGAEYGYFVDDTDFAQPTDVLDTTTEILGGGGTPIHGENESFYFEDSWDVTNRLNVQLGIRDDIFKLNNLQGAQVLDLDNNFGPRVALSYDPFGHKTDKVTLSYGRYFIPPASNLSFRGADLGGDEYFLPPSGTSFTPFIGPTGFPTSLGIPITAAAAAAAGDPTGAFQAGEGSSSVCPKGFVLPGVAACSLQYGPGIQEPAETKAAQNLSATYEDEVIVGYEKKLTSLLTVHATVTYRTLGDESEDIDNLGFAISAFCARTPSHTGCSTPGDQIVDSFNAMGDYKLINPGQHAVITVRPDEMNADTGGPLTGIAGQTFDLSAEDLGFPQAKRDYEALELGFDRAFDGKWSLSGSYTFSKLIGNYEGTVKSDAGNSAQVDAGSTEAFDYPGLTDYDYGLLPNDRTHEIKLYGSYQVLPNLLIGANLQVTSPRSYGCIGYYPAPGSKGAAGGFGGVDPTAAFYGNAARYCYQPQLGYDIPTPRGDVFQGDWFEQLDMSVRYTLPKFSKYVPGNLVLRVDAFNIFNTQQVIQNSEVGDASNSGTAAVGTYKLPVYYQTPRYVRFGFDYTF